MRKIIVTMWVSLDGFIAGPNDEMDWITNIYGKEMGIYESELIHATDTLILGRKTYDSFAGAWPRVAENPDANPDEAAYARRLNVMNKVVFSKSLATADWSHSQLLREIRAEEINELKQQPGGDMVIYGSVSIIRALTNLGLIDEYQLLIHPIVLGSGKPLFAGVEQRVNLKLVNSTTFPSGVVVLTYQQAEK